MSSTVLFEFVPGRKAGSRNALYEGHLYHKNSYNAETTYWVCNRCPARLTTKKGVYHSSSRHCNHEAQHADVAVHIAKANVKRLASSSDHPTKRICAEAQEGLSPEDLLIPAKQTSPEDLVIPATLTSPEGLFIPPRQLQSSSADSDR